MALHKPIDIPLPPTNNWVTKQRVENTVVIFADLSGFMGYEPHIPLLPGDNLQASERVSAQKIYKAALEAAETTDYPFRPARSRVLLPGSRMPGCGLLLVWRGGLLGR